MADEIKEEEPVVSLPIDQPIQSLPTQERIENIYGTLIRVITTPTWTPKSFYEGIQKPLSKGKQA